MRDHRSNCWETLQWSECCKAYDWTYDREWYGLRRRRLESLWALNGIVLCQYGLLLECQEHMECQVLVYRFCLSRRGEAARMRTGSFWRLNSLWSLGTPLELYEILSTRLLAAGIDDVKTVRGLYMKSIYGRIWLDGEMGNGYGSERYDVWLQLDLPYKVRVNHRRVIPAH